MQRVAEGDRVGYPIRYGGDLEKVHKGVVVDVGKRGVLVKFDDPKLGQQWLKSNQFRVETPAKADGPAQVETRKGTDVKPPVILKGPPPSLSAPAQERDLAADLEAWRNLARDLMERAIERAHFADRAVEVAKQELADAEAEAKKANADLHELRRAVGGS